MSPILLLSHRPDSGRPSWMPGTCSVMAQGSGSNPGGVYNIGPVYISMSELRPREENLEW